MEEVSLHAPRGRSEPTRDVWHVARGTTRRRAHDSLPRFILDLFSIYSGAALDGELPATWTTRYVSAEIEPRSRAAGSFLVASTDRPLQSDADARLESRKWRAYGAAASCPGDQAADCHVSAVSRRKAARAYYTRYYYVVAAARACACVVVYEQQWCEL